MVLNDLSETYTFIDSHAEWKLIFKDCKFKLNPDLFLINEIFYHYDKVNRRKRKRITQEIFNLQEFHNKLINIVKHYEEKYVTKNMTIKHIMDEAFNESAREISRRYIDDSELIQCCNNLKDNNQFLVFEEKFRYFHKLIINNDLQWKEIEVLSGKYWLPPMSSFIMSDIKFASKFLNFNKKFDLIVIDPPVFNSSVKLKSVYNFIEENDILELPLRQLMNDDCIVAIWCTNNEKCLDSVQSCMMPAWGLNLRAECTWLKVTNRGESVLDINDPYRRPYEKLFISRFIRDFTKSAFSQDDPLFNLHDHVILSVPCSLHSAKPNLENFLKPYLSNDKIECLELFARNLYPGWTSWGNEPLKLLKKDLMVPNLKS